MARGIIAWAFGLAFAALLLGTSGRSLAQTPTPTPGTGGNLPDLAVSMTANPSPVNSGDLLTYTIVVRNQGAVASTKTVRLEDGVPGGTTFNSAQGPCSLEGTIVACPVGPLGAGATATFTFTVSVTTLTGPIFNTAALDPAGTQAESDRSNNGASIVTTVRAASPTGTTTPVGTFGPSPTTGPTLTVTMTPTRTPGMSGSPSYDSPSSRAASGSSSGVRTGGAPGEAMAAPPPPPIASGPLPFGPADMGPPVIGPDMGPAGPGAIEPVGAAPVQPGPATFTPALLVVSPTEAFSVTMDPLWVAQPGERYLIALEEDGWALAVWEGDPPSLPIPVWILLDTRIERLTQGSTATR